MKSSNNITSGRGAHVINGALRWLDSLLRDEVRKFRAVNAVPIEEFQGIYISDKSVDSLLAAERPDADAQAELGHSATVHRQLRANTAIRELVLIPEWQRLIKHLQLSDTDIALLIIAIAPETDLKYETVYAYLQNDISRRLPTRDLALRLLSGEPEGETAIRNSLSAGSPLFMEGVLSSGASGNGLGAGGTAAHWRSGSFAMHPLVVHSLLYGERSELQLPRGCRYSVPSIQWHDIPVGPKSLAKLSCLPQLLERTETKAPLILFEGPDMLAAEMAAQSLARSLETGFIIIDLHDTQDDGWRISQQTAIRSAHLHQILHGSVVCYRISSSAELRIGKDEDKGSEMGKWLNTFLHHAPTSPGPIIIISSEAFTSEADLRGLSTVSFQFDPPCQSEREKLWEEAFSAHNISVSAGLQKTISSQFILTSGQIHAAAQQVLSTGIINSETTDSHVLEAARSQSRLTLGALARRVNTHYTYNDLVLPDITKSMVKEVAFAISHRGVVYNEWGFSQRFPQGQGVKVLFSGASGTGKTMAAAVIAREVGLDLYAIDLSGIVSKYIGETEKNLDRVFAATHNSNAILFFDECDALFGKRSEVKDAHDRYANIEVAYLLQKMEAHEGAVIMATNFSRNMDQAFARRMQYVIEFPVPDAPLRERLWRGMFPANAPLSSDIDFTFIAEHFALAGGDIRNVALDAAFLAVQDRGEIAMRHIVRALARQLVKQGRSPSAIEFKQYFPLISRDNSGA